MDYFAGWMAPTAAVKASCCFEKQLHGSNFAFD